MKQAILLCFFITFSYNMLAMQASAAEKAAAQIAHDVFTLAAQGWYDYDRIAKCPTIADKDGNTVLHIAVSRGNINAIKNLYHKFPELKNIKNSGKRTPLLLATSLGNIKSVQTLLQLGESIDYIDDSGGNLLHYAALSNNAELILFVYRNAPHLINSPNVAGRTPLLTAAMYGNFEAAECLLEEGADFTVCDNEGQSVFHYAASSGKHKLFSYLLTVYLVINRDVSVLTKPDRHGRYLILHIAFEVARNNRTSLTKYLRRLLKYPINYQKKSDVQGNTLVHYAFETTNIEFIEAVLEYQSALTSKNSDGLTAIELAQKKQNFTVLLYLLARTKISTETVMGNFGLRDILASIAVSNGYFKNNPTFYENYLLYIIEIINNRPELTQEILDFVKDLDNMLQTNNPLCKPAYPQILNAIHTPKQAAAAAAANPQQITPSQLFMTAMSCAITYGLNAHKK